jgi:arylsulfatase A-like enzyme
MWWGLAALSLLCSLSAARPPATPRPNVILIVIDTLRADATSLNDPESNNTPFLASLALRGTVFTSAYSTHDFTPPSHFSIMTGLRDGLGSNDDRPENGLAYQLTLNGYDTFAVAANNLIGTAQMPVHRAFRRFLQPGTIDGGSWIDAVGDTLAIDMRLRMFHCNATPHARAVLWFSADRLLPMFLEQIRTAQPPYFGFVNLVDPHEPYVPDPSIYPPEKSLPPNFNGDVLGRRLGPELADPESIADPARRAHIESLIRAVRFPRLVAADLSPEALAIYHRRYNATVRGVDRTLADFFAALEREKLLDNTIVIITSDHGESFGEAGFLTHMLGDHGDYEATHHVPLLVVMPKKFAPAAARIDRPVSIADLAPTIYDLAGVDWSPLAKRYPKYARSLATMFAPAPIRTGRVELPAPSPQDARQAQEEREKAMRALGYMQ